jgi:hypothetical protein
MSSRYRSDGIFYGNRNSEPGCILTTFKLPFAWIINSLLSFSTLYRYEYSIIHYYYFSLSLPLIPYENKALLILRLKALGVHTRRMEKIGISMQYFMLDQIKNWNHNEQVQRIEIIKLILKEIFELEYESTEMIDYKTFNFGFGLLSVVEAIKRIREQSIQLLITFYESAEKTSDKLIILDALQEATKTPNRGNYSEKVETLVKENTTCIVRWYSTIIEQDAALEVMKEIDEQSNWFARRFESVDGLSALSKRINSNDRYIIYKDLVGYDSDYLEKLDWRKSREIRTGKIKQYIDNISAETKDYWTALIVNICAGYNIHNQGKYAYFNQFLYDLACKRPEFVQSLILKHEEDIKDFLHHLIAGLITSKYIFAHQKMEQWIETGTHLINCVLSFLYSDNVDIDILESIFDKASTNKESQALHELFRILNTSKIDKMMSKSLYIKVI